jgi:hypothetical protein
VATQDVAGVAEPFVQQRHLPHMLKCGFGFFSICHALSILQGQKGLQPVFQLVLRTQHQPKAVILCVQSNHMFVFRVLPLVDVEARFQ